MVRNVNVDTVLKSMGRGISEPALIIADDGNRYILKTEKVHHPNQGLLKYDCMFLNELLAYLIGEYLGIPMPEAAIAYLDQTLIDHDKTLIFVNKFYEGDLFASKELEEKEDNLVENFEMQMQLGRPYLKRTWNVFFAQVENKEDLIKIIAFDLLIANFDRYGNEGNLLVSSEGGQRKIYTIDHGHAFFGPVWDINKQRYLQLAGNNPSEDYCNYFINIICSNNSVNLDGAGSVFNSIQSTIDLTNIDSNPFRDIVSLIEGISGTVIDSWLNQIPNTWYTDEARQKTMYKNFLLEQKKLLRNLIQQMAVRKAFTNYLGGDLLWENEKDVGIQ